MIFEDRGQGGATPILFNYSSAQEILQPLHALLHALISYLRLKFGRNLCVRASFSAKIVVRSSISSTPLTSTFADAMEDDGTAVDRRPRGSGSMAGLPMICFMQILHEPVTCVKISRV